MDLTVALVFLVSVGSLPASPIMCSAERDENFRSIHQVESEAHKNDTARNDTGEVSAIRPVKDKKFQAVTNYSLIIIIATVLFFILALLLIIRRAYRHRNKRV